jgi:hypothetical protein
MKTTTNDFGYPMNLHAYFTRGIIWSQRLLFSKLLNGINDHRPIPLDFSGQAANDYIRELLKRDAPCLVARFGCVELDAVLRGYDISRGDSLFKKALCLLTGAYGPFWWDNSIRAGLLRTTGVFPADDATMMRFSARVLADVKAIDVLGTWNARECELRKKFFPNGKAVGLTDLDAFCFKNPWTSALAGKRVLVVHPFCQTIASQYARREKLFDDPQVLPDFKLITYRPVSSFLGLETPYKDWFEALDKMCADIAKIDFDVALIGCGAYGMSIGAFVKRELRKKAVHLGGVTQMLFGIKGGRWDGGSYSRFYNEFWVRPGDEERPDNYRVHEGGAYW